MTWDALSESFATKTDLNTPHSVILTKRGKTIQHYKLHPVEIITIEAFEEFGFDQFLFCIEYHMN